MISQQVRGWVKKKFTCPIIPNDEVADTSATQQRALVCTVMWFEGHAQKAHSCASSTWWPTWETRLAWVRRSARHFVGTGNVPVCLAMSLTRSDPTEHSRLGTYCKSSVRKRWAIFHTVRIWRPAIFICLMPWRDRLPGHRFPTNERTILSHHMAYRQQGRIFCTSGMYNLSHAVTSASTVKGTAVKKK